MELALQNNLNVNLGDVITYVNNGIKSSHGDVQKKGEGVQINCYLLDPSDIEKDPNLTGNYNVPRAITTFNKRIEPLLIVFGQEVRDNLLVTDPEQRGIFTTSQCELINGIPFEPEDQDTIEDLLTITDAELKFWERRGLSPDYIYDLAEEGWEKKI
jgi:hypothetical protein